MNKIITRFAPSPTGNLHLGNIRIALYSWLFAKKQNGKFILRIENTDINKSNSIFNKNIFTTLKWLGLYWDDNPIFQLNRLERYDEIIKYMIVNNKAYYCICDKNRLNKLKEYQVLNKIKPKYDRYCRYKKIDINYLMRNNINYVVRFKMPLSGEVIFNDLIHGIIKFNNNELDDFIIKRSNQIPTYNFCVSVDDNDFNISHIIRGNDHISNTPKQINILNSINKKIPIYAHIPIILGENNKKLSKKNNLFYIDKYKLSGILPESINNYLFSLDFNTNDNIYKLDDMINAFNINNINKSFKKLNNNKIYWINSNIIKNIDNNKLILILKEYSKKYKYKFIKNLEKGKKDIFFIIEFYKNRCNSLYEFIKLNDLININIKNNVNIIKNNININKINVINLLKCIKNINIWNMENIKININKFIIKNNLNIHNIYMFLRLIITAKTKTPNIFFILYIVNKNKLINNIKYIIKNIDI